MSFELDNPFSGAGNCDDCQSPGTQLHLELQGGDCVPCATGNLEMGISSDGEATPLGSILWGSILNIPPHVVNSTVLQTFIESVAGDVINAGITVPTTIGDGVTLVFTLDNPLDTADAIVQVQERITGEIVYPTVRITASNIIVTFAQAPVVDEYRVLISK